MQVNSFRSMECKKLLRQEFLSKRNKLNQKTVLDASSLVCKKVLKLSEYKCASKILLYNAVSNELTCEEIFSDAESTGKSVYFPRVLDDERMEFIKASSSADFKLGRFNIYEPVGSERYESDDSALCIVPAICFDKYGFRLGYGKGYYDRFLNGFSGVAIGIAKDEFILDRLPKLKTDISVNKIVTDKNIYNISF